MLSVAEYAVGASAWAHPLQGLELLQVPALVVMAKRALRWSVWAGLWGEVGAARTSQGALFGSYGQIGPEQRP